MCAHIVYIYVVISSACLTTFTFFDIVFLVGSRESGVGRYKPILRFITTLLKKIRVSMSSSSSSSSTNSNRSSVALQAAVSGSHTAKNLSTTSFPSVRKDAAEFASTSQKEDKIWQDSSVVKECQAVRCQVCMTQLPNININFSMVLQNINS